MLSKMLVSGEDINVVEVYTKITEWARLAMENFVAKTAGKETGHVFSVLHTPSHSEPCSAPCPGHVHL